MDNFMDKLAKRFNAGEMIKANAQAEARDLKRLQEQTAQYEHMMQEMRRLNLKNVEVTEQVQQLIQCGIEQFEGYGTADGEIINQIDQKTGSLENKLEEIKAEITRAIAEESNKGSDNTEVLAGISEKLDAFSRDMADELRRNQLEIAGSLRNLEERLSSQNQYEDALAKLDTSIATSRYALEDSVGGIKEEVLATKEILINSQNNVADTQRRFEDFMHRESVRVYRNVQACVVDETQKRGREMSTRMDLMEANIKKATGMKGLVILTFFLVLISLAIQIADILKLLPF